MEEERRITLEEVINIIGEEAGRKYTWFLLNLDAEGIIGEHMSIEDICEKIDSEPLGYYELSWSFLQEISKKLSVVVVFNLLACKSKEDFFERKREIHDKAEYWVNNVDELEFLINDGEIWEITGTDTVLVERLKKTFSPLPIYLM